MRQARSLHREAMDQAEKASVAKLKGDTAGATALLRRAFELEQRAAKACARRTRLEPTRSVLYRSAASLAMECGEYREAERLIAVALSGEPPDEIAEELRDLLEQVYFQRHLELRGVSLAPEEVQLSIAGKAIGFGIAPSELYVERVQAFERLVYRTAERKMGIAYRERGRPEADVLEGFEVFVTVPRAASMAVTLRIGRKKPQMEMPFKTDVPAKDVIEEIAYCVESLNAGRDEAVHNRIGQEAYYNNFVALTREIAPDGDDVTQVGLTIMQEGTKRDVPITRPRKEFGVKRARVVRGPSRLLPDLPDAADADEERVKVCGKLRYADSTGSDLGLIKLVGSDATEHRVIVPEGMMSDIVRPHWDDFVVVRGIRQDGGILLEDIEKASRRKG